MASDAAFSIDVPWNSVILAMEAMRCFKASPFYSRSCNNESPLIMKNDLGTAALERMTGLEFVVDVEASSPPELWVFRKQHRRSPIDVDLVGVFYLLHGTIYQAPEFGNLVESRLSKVTHHLGDALDALSEFKPKSKAYSSKDELPWKSLPGHGAGLGTAIIEVCQASRRCMTCLL